MRIRVPLLGACALALAAACSGGKGGASLPVVTEPLGTADGMLDAWRTLAPMPEARANFCAGKASGWLVAIGGNHSQGGAFVNSDAVHVARLMDGGELGEWKLAGHAPSSVIECTLASDGTHLILVDGIYDDTSKEGHVFVAELSNDGTLGAWSDTGVLPDGRRAIDSEAWLDSNGEILVMDAQLPGEFDGGKVATLSAPIGFDGVPGPWTAHDWMNSWRGEPQYAFDGARLWTLGGYLDASNGNLTVSEVFQVPLAGMTTASAFAVQPLPAPTTFGEAEAVDGWVFVVGGKPAIFGASGVADVFAAPVTTGTLGAWTATNPPLPEGRTNEQIVVAGNWLYVLGGGFSAGGLDTVFVTRVRH